MVVASRYGWYYTPSLLSSPHIVSILWSKSGILLNPHSVWWLCWYCYGWGWGYVTVTILDVVTLYLQLDDMLVSSRSLCIFNMGSCNVGLCKEDILGVTVPLHQGASSLNTRDSIAAQYNTHITQHCQCWWLLTRPKPNSQYLRNCLRRFFRRRTT